MEQPDQQSDKTYPPSPDFAKGAHIDAARYEEMYARSVNDSEGFWAEQAQRLDWMKAPSQIKDVDFTLGQVKIMFPNKHNVYLHDTPSRELFAKSERTFSSGCIRIQDPLGLADHHRVGVAGGHGLLVQGDVARTAPALRADPAPRVRRRQLPRPARLPRRDPRQRRRRGHPHQGHALVLRRGRARPGGAGRGRRPRLRSAGAPGRRPPPRVRPVRW